MATHKFSQSRLLICEKHWDLHPTGVKGLSWFELMLICEKYHYNFLLLE